MEVTASIHIQGSGYWADVPELPGCFASGDTLDELFESLQEGAALYLRMRASKVDRYTSQRQLTDRPLTAA